MPSPEGKGDRAVDEGNAISTHKWLSQRHIVYKHKEISFKIKGFLMINDCLSRLRSPHPSTFGCHLPLRGRLKVSLPLQRFVEDVDPYNDCSNFIAKQRTFSHPNGYNLINKTYPTP